MTLDVGFISDENTVWGLADTVGTFQSNAQISVDTKFRDTDARAYFAIAGSPYFANEIAREIKGRHFDSSSELEDTFLDIYSDLHVAKARREFGRYFKDGEEGIDRWFENGAKPAELLKEYQARMQDLKSERPDILILSNVDGPSIYKITSPGNGALEDNIGSWMSMGDSNAVGKFNDAMDLYLDNVRNEYGQIRLPLVGAMEAILRSAENASRKNNAIGPPFDMVYIQRKLKDDATLLQDPSERYVYEKVNIDKRKLEEVRRKIRDFRYSKEGVPDDVLRYFLERVLDDNFEYEKFKKEIHIQLD